MSNRTLDMNVIHKNITLSIINKLSDSLSELDDPVAVHTKEVLALFRELADKGMFVDGMVAEAR